MSRWGCGFGWVGGGAVGLGGWIRGVGLEAVAAESKYGSSFVGPVTRARIGRVVGPLGLWWFRQAVHSITTGRAPGAPRYSPNVRGRRDEATYMFPARGPK